MKVNNIQVPHILEEEKTPLVVKLLDIIENQQALVHGMAETIQQLKDEIARLKNHNQKPKIKPSKLNDPKSENKENQKNDNGKRPGSAKKSKTADLKIHKVETIEPENIPEGSVFREYRDFVVQDIILESCNTQYRLKVYETTDGKLISGKLPEHLDGKHFGGDLISFCLYQNYHCGVTQPLLLDQLHDLGVEISNGQLNNILIENKDLYHNEKERILEAGLKYSSYVNVDDTGARHDGKNGYCTHVGNEDFAWFESTESKSRINFLKLIRAGNTDYHINEQAINYMRENKLPNYILDIITVHTDLDFPDDKSWENFLSENNIEKAHHIRIATEGALTGSIAEHGISDDLVIVSDDAGQFNVFLHGLCWIHTERLIAKIVPYTEEAAKDLENIRSRIWDFYDKLKDYKQQPTGEFKEQLEAEFDEIFTTQTSSAILNNALKRLWKNKTELLLVLERPEIPLHNNTAENSIREYVKKRKISGSTRSAAGRRCRDTFASLKKTCLKQGISFWRYLKDRVFQRFSIPHLSDLIQQNAEKQVAGSI